LDRPNVSWMYLCWWMNDVLKVSQLQFYVTLNIPHRYLRRFVQAATCVAWCHCCTYCQIIGESQILFQFKLTTLSRIDTKFANLIIGVLWQSKSQLIIKTHMNQLNRWYAPDLSMHANLTNFAFLLTHPTSVHTKSLISNRSEHVRTIRLCFRVDCALANV